MKKLGCFFYKTACALSIGLMASSFIVVSTGNAAAFSKPKVAAESKKNPPLAAAREHQRPSMSTERGNRGPVITPSKG